MCFFYLFAPGKVDDIKANDYAPEFPGNQW